MKTLPLWNTASEGSYYSNSEAHYNVTKWNATSLLSVVWGVNSKSVSSSQDISGHSGGVKWLMESHDW